MYQVCQRIGSCRVSFVGWRKRQAGTRLFQRGTIPVAGLLVLVLLSGTPAWSSGDTGDAEQSPSPPLSRECPVVTDVRDPNVYVGPSVSDRPFLKKLAANVLLDQKEIWTSPFHVNRSSAKWWMLAGVSTAALLAADHPTSQALPASGTTVHFAVSASRAGQWYTVFPAAGILYTTGWATRNEKLAEAGALSLEALADADLVSNILKVVARRERPKDGDHGGHFEKGGASFPSAHSTQAWALATVLAEEYGNHRWIPYVAYGYAALVSTSRVLAQDHFPSDVLVGGAIGFFIGRYVVRTQEAHRHHPQEKRSRGWTPSVWPAFSPDEKQVTLAWTY